MAVDICYFKLCISNKVISLLFNRVTTDNNMSSPTTPRVDSLAWEDEAKEERVQRRRAQYLHLTNDPDPKNKSIAQQALALAAPLANTEDAILHMDGFYLVTLTQICSIFTTQC